MDDNDVPRRESTSMESTEATVDVYAHLHATERVHDRMCTRACVCVNTFVGLSPFACPTSCKYMYVELTSVHMRDACKRVLWLHRRPHPYKLHVGMFRCQQPSSNNYTSNCVDSSNQNTSEVPLRKLEK